MEVKGNLKVHGKLTANLSPESLSAVRDKFYPVGVAIECTSSPAEALGGTWEEIAPGKWRRTE